MNALQLVISQFHIFTLEIGVILSLFKNGGPNKVYLFLISIRILVNIAITDLNDGMTLGHQI